MIQNSYFLIFVLMVKRRERVDIVGSPHPIAWRAMGIVVHLTE